MGDGTLVSATRKRRTGRQAPSVLRPAAGWPRWMLAAVAMLAIAGGGWVLRSSTASDTAALQPDDVVRSLRVDVLRRFPHDTTAYTQGLLWWAGKLYESTGQYGESTLRRIDPMTGVVEQLVEISPAYFGEGLARVDDRLIMLTWKAQRAFVHDLDDFAQLGTLRYAGEGWGLCNDGTRLIMSSGSDILSFRDGESFDEIGQVRVTLRGRPLTQLNELECMGDEVYANVYQRDFLVRIDPATGRVTHQIDATGLLTPAEARGVDVLNGIAYNPESDTFYITGKDWPTMFEVRFIE